MLANQPAGVDGHPVAHLHRRDVIDHRRHAAGHLMAQHHWLLDAHGAKATVVGVVQIRPADAAKSHPHQHLAGADLAGIPLVQPQVGGAWITRHMWPAGSVGQNSLAADFRSAPANCRLRFRAI